jgi:hypothetical protein
VLKALLAFAFSLWSLAAPAMAAENVRALQHEAPAAHCALMADASPPAGDINDLPDCCRVPSPLLAEPGDMPAPAIFETVQFDPWTDDRMISLTARPELPPPRA